MRAAVGTKEFLIRVKRSPGFTLVELLVVIGIIGLLIPILLPALGKVRKQARQVACLSDMRQLSQMVMMYVNTNKGSLPYGDWSGGPDTAAWFGRVSQVSGIPISTRQQDSTVWTCPVAQADGYARTEVGGQSPNDILYSNLIAPAAGARRACCCSAPRHNGVSNRQNVRTSPLARPNVGTSRQLPPPPSSWRPAS